MSRLTTRLAALALLLLAGPAAAGNLTVAPTRIDLGGARGSGSVTLENNATEPVLVQVETFAWAEGSAPTELGPTQDLVAVPPVFSLEPGGRQIIRVALREPGGRSIETAYRLLISEVPSGGPVKGGGVKFALRLSLPVFATPNGAAPSPHWLLRRNGKGGELELVNAGTAHLQVRRLRLRSAGGKVQTFDRPAYVLAGQSQAWSIRLPVEAGATFTLEADTNIGQLELPLTAQGG